MKILLLILLVLGPCTLASAQEEKAAVVLGPEAFHQQMQREGVLLVDVRTPEEFEEGHLEGALNIDFKSEDFLERMLELDKEKPLLLYCRSGNRSGKAAKLLSENGFDDITDLEGGIVLWQEYLNGNK